MNRGFTRIEVAGAADTIPYAIDDSGNIAGTYDDSAGVWHGFLRVSSAAYTLFDVPGAGTGRTQGTTPVAMNDTGEITGYYGTRTISSMDLSATHWATSRPSMPRA